MSEVKDGDKKPLDDVTKIILKSGILTPRMLTMYVKPDHDIRSVVKYIQEILMDLKTSNEKMIAEFQKKNDAEGIQPYRIRKRAHEHLLNLLKDETKTDDDRFSSYKADLKKLDRIFFATSIQERSALHARSIQTPIFQRLGGAPEL